MTAILPPSTPSAPQPSVSSRPDEEAADGTAHPFQDVLAKSQGEDVTPGSAGGQNVPAPKPAKPAMQVEVSNEAFVAMLATLAPQPIPTVVEPLDGIADLGAPGIVDAASFGGAPAAIGEKSCSATDHVRSARIAVTDVRQPEIQVVAHEPVIVTPAPIDHTPFEVTSLVTQSQESPSTKLPVTSEPAPIATPPLTKATAPAISGTTAAMRKEDMPLPTTQRPLASAQATPAQAAAEPAHAGFVPVERVPSASIAPAGNTQLPAELDPPKSPSPARNEELPAVATKTDAPIALPAQTNPKHQYREQPQKEDRAATDRTFALQMLEVSRPVEFSVAPLSVEPLHSINRTDIVQIVERTAEAATHLRASGNEGMEVSVRLGSGHALTIRLHMENGKVTPVIHTESDALRHALESNWSQFTDSVSDRALRIATPIFESGRTSSDRKSVV